MAKTSSKNGNVGMSKFVKQSGCSNIKKLNRLHKAAAKLKQRASTRGQRSFEESIIGRGHEWTLGTYSLDELAEENVYDKNLEAVPLFVFVKPENVRHLYVYDVIYPLALLGVVPRDSEDIAVIECHEDEIDYIELYIRPLLESGDFCLVWDQSGVMQNAALARSDMFEWRDEEHRGIVFNVDTFDFTNISKEDTEYIDEVAICSAERNYAQAIGITGGAAEKSEYEYAKQAVESFGTGYVEFMFDEEDFDEVVSDQFWRHIDEKYASMIVRNAPNGIFDNETFNTWEKAATDTRNMMRIWQYAIELAKLPVNIVGYRYNEEEVYNRAFDTDMTRKLGDIIGVHPMLENYFVHGVPIEDILA